MRYGITVIALLILAGCATSGTDVSRVYYDRKYNTVASLQPVDAGAATAPVQRRGTLNPNHRY